ncbi:MAG: TolC family outer membrane protein, partial [Desulfobacterales bacterium]|nr:TolC family outer membrane protein [Desulfobacterales bacterium]
MKLSIARICVPLLCALLLLDPASGHAEDLLAVYLKAKRLDPLYIAAGHALAAADEKPPQAKAGLRPAVSLNAARGRQSGPTRFNDAPDEDRTARNWNWTLQLNQPLFRWDRWVGIDLANIQVDVARLQYAQAHHELIFRVAQAYFDVLVARRNLTVAERQVEAVAKQLELALRNFEVGVATITDTHEARSRHDLARAQRVAAESELDARGAELEKIVGDAPGPLSALPDEVALPQPQPADVQPWITQARDSNLQVRVQQLAAQAAATEIARERAGHAPSLDLTVATGRNFNAGSLSSPTDIAARYRSTQVGLQLNIPLYAGGAVSSRVREAAARRDKAQSEADAARRQATAAVRQAFVGVVNGQAQIEALNS